MKVVTATAKNVRGSARKARIPAQIVKGMYVSEALPVLKYMPKKAAHDVYKVIHSAMANAVHNYDLKEEHLIIKNIRVNQSFGLKRSRSAARGMARPIKKHFCHICVEIIDSTETEKQPVRSDAKKASVKKQTTKSKINKTAKTKKTTGSNTKKTEKSTDKKK